MRLSALGLFVLLITPMLLRFGVMLNYLVEFRYYAEVLCVNQDKPELECNGRCALMTELNALENPGDTEAPVLPDFKIKESIAEVVPAQFGLNQFEEELNSFQRFAPPLVRLYLPVEEEPPGLV